MFVFVRLFRFHRRSGMSLRHSFRRALATTLRDFHL